MTRGFTLIEAVISIALITVLVLGSYAIATAVRSATDRVRVSAALLQEAQFARERIIDELYTSTNVSVREDGALILDYYGGMKAAFTREGAALVYRTGATDSAVIAGAVAVDSFSTSYGPDGDLILSLTLSARDGAGTTTETFIYTLYP